jgi:hypothetical protein
MCQLADLLERFQPFEALLDCLGIPGRRACHHLLTLPGLPHGSMQVAVNSVFNRSALPEAALELDQLRENC